MAYLLNYTGTRITDAIAGVLTGADLTAYNNATSGQIVEISATGYENMLAQISGAGRYGTTQQAMAVCTGNWGGSGYAAAVGTDYWSSADNLGALFIPANNYPFAFSVQGNGVANTQAVGNFVFGFYGAAGGIGSSYTPQTVLGSNSTAFSATAGAAVRRYFVMKNASVATSVQSAFYTAALTGSNYMGAFSMGATRQGVKYGTPATLNTLTTGYSWFFGIQCLATNIKQW